jgi:hypothetical protein
VFDGDLIAAGSFTSIGGVAASYLAAYDGVAWRPLGESPDGPVQALAVWNGELIAAGSFTSIGGIAASRIAGWDGGAWHALGGGVDDAVACLAPSGDRLVVGGWFTQAGDLPASHIASWNGAGWDTLGAGTNELVRCVTAFRGDVIAGGRFTRAGDADAGHIARWNGSRWIGLDSGTNGEVTALAAFDGALFVGGFFTGAGSAPSPGVARWTGSRWTGLGSGLEDRIFHSPAAFAFLPRGDTLMVGGLFSAAGGKPAYNLTTWSSATIVTPPEPPNDVTLRLEVNYPNPFSTGTTFSFSLPAAARVRLTLHDLNGRRVATLFDGMLNAGPRSLQWNTRGDHGERVESGIYFARLESGGVARVRKIALVR